MLSVWWTTMENVSDGTTQDLEQKILKLYDIFLNIWKTIIVR